MNVYDVPQEADAHTPLASIAQELEETLLAEREKAITDRRQSGFETIWAKNRAQYRGKGAPGQDQDQKSQTLDGPVVTFTADSTGTKFGSSPFVNITRPYTNAAIARISDIILPVGNKANWSLESTPTSESELIKPYLATIDGLPAALARLQPASTQRLLAPPEQQQVAIALCRDRIEDNLGEAKWYAETRKQIRESGIVGTGVIKGLFPADRALSEETEKLLSAFPIAASTAGATPNEITLLLSRIDKEVRKRPNVQSIPVENLYPDYPACGDSIHKGAYVWEEIPNKSKSAITALLSDPTYLPDALAAVLEEGPQRPTAQSGKASKSYSIWLRTGKIGSTFAQCEYINNRLVKVGQPALSTVRFPYHCLCFEPRDDAWAGIGVPEQIETPQRGLNASCRGMLDNLAWVVGPQVLIRQGLIEPMEGDDWELRPYKQWHVTEKGAQALFGTDNRAEEAIKLLKFDSILGEVMPVIEFWLRMAEQTTGLPLLLQGQMATDAVAIASMAMNSATTNLRLLVKHWDDDCCVPIIDDFYRWEQTYGPDEVKADAVAQAKGSTILVEKELAQQAYVQLLDRSIQPSFGLSPQRIAAKLVESLHIAYEDVKITPEEQQQLQTAEQQPDAKVEVAQIRAETDIQIQQMKMDFEGRMAGMEAQLKGLSLDQSQQAVEAQGQANIQQEHIRQLGSAARTDATNQAKQEQASPTLGGSAEPNIDEALDVIGL